jgi:hypothetical protein
MLNDSGEKLAAMLHITKYTFMADFSFFFNLMRIFGPKRDEVTGKWRKLHNEQLHDLYSSSTILRVIKSRRMRWEGHVARMGDRRVQGFGGET